MSWQNILKGQIKVQVGIDSPPGFQRPDFYIDEVLEGLEVDEIGEPVSKSFGAWIWEFMVDDADWESFVPTLRDRLTDLVNDPNANVRGGKYGKIGEDEE
jgi:hypothetical protein